jgi:hypothetical protein
MLTRPRALHPALPALLLLLSLAGCGGNEELVRKRDGIRSGNDELRRRRDEIRNDPPVALELGLTSGKTSWCPDAWPPAELQVTVKSRHGHQRRTPQHFDATGPAFLAGALPFDAVDLRVTGGARLNPEWVLLSPVQPLWLLYAPLTVAAHLRYEPAPPASLTINVTFDCDQLATFAGRPGRPGVNSGPGEWGEPGGKAAVALTYVHAKTGRRVIFVKAVLASGDPAYYLLEQGRQLFFDVRGGPGGPGGDAPPNTPGPLAGGTGGDGGDGGAVSIYIDRRYPDLRAAVTVKNEGGQGGPPGKGTGVAYPGRAGRAGLEPRVDSGDVDDLFYEEIKEGLPIKTPPPSGDRLKI